VEIVVEKVKEKEGKGRERMEGEERWLKRGLRL